MLQEHEVVSGNSLIQEFSRMIFSQTQRLHQQIRQIIEIGAAKSFDLHQLPRERLDICTFFLGLHEQFKPLAETRRQVLRCSLDIEADSTFLVDPVHLRSAIEALIFNAIRFTPDGGTIAVEVSTTAESLVCRVRDNGIGIRPEDRPHIFEPFWESQSIEHHSSGMVEFMSSGMGLGLTLAKRMVELHGGTIAVESKVGKGSVFTILLPKNGLGMA